MLLAVLTAAVILLRLERRPFSDLGLSLKGHASGLWYGLLMAILLYLLGFGISVVLGEIEVTGFQFKPLDLLGSWVFFLLVALFEEILMRGYILGRLLHTNMNKFLALFISSALFAFMHIFNPEIAFLPMLNLLLAGMLLGASYLYTRNLCFPISLHLFWNWIQGPIWGKPALSAVQKGRRKSLCPCLCFIESSFEKASRRSDEHEKDQLYRDSAA